MQAVHRLLRERLERVELNSLWKPVHAAFEVGEALGNWLHFNREQREMLRELARRAWGFDPLEGIPDGTRREVAARSIDEKIARERPGDRHVLVKGRLPVPLPSLGPELSLRVPLAGLDLGAVVSVVVIENLDSFDDWHTYPAPAGLADSLVLYRGHGGLARGARRLLEMLPPSCEVTVFPDWDPAGLFIAQTLPRADTLLVPELGEALLALGSREHFDRQHLAARHLDAAELGGWQGIWEAMKAAQVSVKQQHMLALGTVLRQVPRH
ncbi:DUF7281 domain-containing protein [Azotobacter salinestris]|uniref:DUF7281 domain-containing protein n=1 Tax=Azotobacter salinestris TaxID=69964 RepID=UPI0032DE862F